MKESKVTEARDAQRWPAEGYGGYGGAQPTVAVADDDEIDIRALLMMIWRRRWIVAISVLIALALGVLAVTQLTPQYKADATVFYDPERLNVIDLQEVLVSGSSQIDEMQNQIEVLNSQTLLQRVTDKLNIGALAEFNPELRTGPKLLIERVREFVAEQIDLARTTLTDLGALPPPPVEDIDEEEEKARFRLRMVEALRARLSFSPIRNSRVIRIEATTTQPRLSARIANAVAEQYIVDQLEAKLDATRSATDWLSTRVQELKERVRAAEDAVEAARTELSLEAGQGSDITREQLQALNAELAQARADVTQIETRYDTVSGAIDEARDLGAVSEFRQSSIIQRYREQENQLLDQQASLAASVPVGHPAIERLNARLEELRASIRDEAQRIATSLANDLDASRQREAALVSDLRRLETKALEQSRNELSLRQLDREAEASRLLYENFLARLKETSEQQSLQSADARILSEAEPPIHPDGRSKKLIVIFAGLLGGMVGLGLVFLLEQLNNTYRGVAELEEATGQTVLASLPRIGAKLRRSEVLAHLRKKPNSSLAEAVRNLRTSILFSNVDTPPQVVMFTSSAPREGKSTTSMLVALTSRQMGKSAVIVDCDLRLPALAGLISADRAQPGLLNVLSGAASIEEAVFVEPETGLHVLTNPRLESGAQINAADVLASQRFRTLIDELKQRYDLVILDTPPALVVTDARIVASQADAVVYAVRWDHTPRGAVLEGLREMSSVKAPIAGLVLTMVNEARAAKYAYEGYGYYKGRYKDYYVS